MKCRLGLNWETRRFIGIQPIKQRSQYPNPQKVAIPFSIAVLPLIHQAYFVLERYHYLIARLLYRYTVLIWSCLPYLLCPLFIREKTRKAATSSPRLPGIRLRYRSDAAEKSKPSPLYIPRYNSRYPTRANPVIISRTCRCRSRIQRNSQ